MSIVNTIKPLYVVKPASVDDVYQIIKLANYTLTPLVPVSSGPPHFRGDTAPSIGGAVIVDLSKMKKMINVDRPRRVAMAEAGVTFSELIRMTVNEGIRINMPLLPRKTKAVFGSLLKSEHVVMPGYQWDIADPLVCLGVIFGTDDEFRTMQGVVF